MAKSFLNGQKSSIDKKICKGVHDNSIDQILDQGYLNISQQQKQRNLANEIVQENCELQESSSSLTLIDKGIRLPPKAQQTQSMLSNYQREREAQLFPIIRQSLQEKLKLAPQPSKDDLIHVLLTSSRKTSATGKIRQQAISYQASKHDPEEVDPLQMYLRNKPKKKQKRLILKLDMVESSPIVGNSAASTKDIKPLKQQQMRKKSLYSSGSAHVNKLIFCPLPNIESHQSSNKVLAVNRKQVLCLDLNADSNVVDKKMVKQNSTERLATIHEQHEKAINAVITPKASTLKQNLKKKFIQPPSTTSWSDHPEISRNSKIGLKKQQENKDNQNYQQMKAKQRQLPELNKSNKKTIEGIPDNFGQERSSRAQALQQQFQTNMLAEQNDPDKKMSQLENMLTNKSKKDQGPKSRDLQRQWMKIMNEEQSRNQSISPMRSRQKEEEQDGEVSMPAEESATKEKLKLPIYEDRLVCLIKTQEPHLKRAVERRSKYWVENKGKSMQAVFDVKFEFQDKEEHYSSAQLKPTQMFNHFPNNSEITTKSGLCRSLYANTNPVMKVDAWFPRCYDLSQNNQTDDLVDDYLSTALQIIIKKHYLMFKELCKSKMEKTYLEILKLKELRDSGKSAYNFKDNKSRLFLELNKQMPCFETVLVNIKHLDRALKFCKKLIKNQYSDTNMNDLVVDEIRPHDARHGFRNTGYEGPINKMFNEKIWNELLSYSKVDFPITDYAGLPESIKPLKKELATTANGQVSGLNSLNDGFSRWERPSLLLIYRIYKYHKLMKQAIPQYSTDGINNVWIVKPCYNARGFGIYCIDNCLSEFKNNLSNNSAQSKIVMKYIEKPLLLNHNNEVRKFDIRQWVLVTSYDPLEIYIFKEFYLRICGSKYDLNDIQDSYKHLTNFSIQKHNSKVANKELDLVLNQEEFFYKAFKNDPKKCEKVRKGLEEVIIKTIRTAQESNLEHRSNCFEIYGFDFMLDRKLNPWLLEVNLSPACAERTEWLVGMLDRMTSGLFNLIERKLWKVTDDFKGELKNYLKSRAKQKLDYDNVDGWKLIYNQAQSQNFIHLQKQNNSSGLFSQFTGFFGGSQKNMANEPVASQAVLQTQLLGIVQGTKIQVNVERKVQQLYLHKLAAPVIQKCYRGHLGRKKVAQIKFENIITFIQSCLRMFLAKNEKIRRLQMKKSVIVQKFMRRYLAKGKLFKMRSDAFDAMKLAKIVMIQRQARVFISKLMLERLIKESKAEQIQKFIKGKLAYTRVKKYRFYMNQVRFLQVFFRSRYAIKSRKAVTVQKFMKGKLCVTKFRRLSKIKRGYSEILE